MKAIRRIGSAVFLALVLGLAGCGGGGGGGDAGGEPGGGAGPGSENPPPPAAKAEGAYATDGIWLFVLENDELWGVYQIPDPARGNRGVHAGFVQGAGVSDDGSYGIADLHDFYFDPLESGDPPAGLLEASVSGSYEPGVSLNLEVTPEQGQAYTVSATAAAVDGYSYGQAARPEIVAGDWLGFYGNGEEEGPVNIALNGAITATTSRNCSYSGTITPRPSGKNVYDVRIVQGGAPCGLPGQTMTGIAVVNALAAQESQLVVMLIDATRSVGATFVGTK